MKILDVRQLKKYYPIHSGILRRRVGDVKAVDEVSFSIEEGEMLALVGESGSGKSTVGLSILRLIEPTGGSIELLGKNLLALTKKELRLLRKDVQIIFQDPLSSLSPRKNILENIGEALVYHGLVKNKAEQIDRVITILEAVGLSKEALKKYPHEFSGGQQQRISIGRAIALKPKLIICDEVVSALDISIQAQILNLLYDLKKEFNLSYLFISHDLSIVRKFCDTILVMYKGKIVERGRVEEIFSEPQHPYTKNLFASIPKIHPKEKRGFKT